MRTFYIEEVIVDPNGCKEIDRSDIYETEAVGISDLLDGLVRLYGPTTGILRNDKVKSSLSRQVGWVFDGEMLNVKSGERKSVELWVIVRDRRPEVINHFHDFEQSTSNTVN